MAITTKEEYKAKFIELVNSGYDPLSPKAIKIMWNEVKGNLSDDVILECLREIYPGNSLLTLKFINDLKKIHNLE